MSRRPLSLSELTSFGDVAAEDDAVLDYFLTTDAVRSIAENRVFLVLGRKGAGKTAIVRYFSEGTAAGTLSRAISLRGYPWNLHAQRIDRGASDIEAYVSSWRYLLVSQLAALLLSRVGGDSTPEAKSILEFFRQNYGGPDVALSEILRPRRLQLSKLSFEPSVFGNKLGGIALERSPTDLGLGMELNALTDSILGAIRTLSGRVDTPILLHLDELDQGLSTLDEARTRMLVGLVLAARTVRQQLRGTDTGINTVVYLRTDLWDDLEFSDKNKVSQTSALDLIWESASLQRLVDARLRAKLAPGATWDVIAEPGLMRGSQTKWNHILARTFLRPRDVIKFLNSALEVAKTRGMEPLLFSNEDIVDARETYSRYLKDELDDEILPHWPHWEEALQACSAIATVTFERDQFLQEYGGRKTGANVVGPDDALAKLYRFSVIGYERRSGYGGSSWAFQYTDPEAGWDNSATRFKVHLGLKEYAKLREERQ